jgi:hypothetical protein
MSLKRCCCVSAMRNVRHREIDDVGSDAIKTTQDVRGKRSYIEQEKFGGCWSPLLPARDSPLLECAGYSFLRERAGLCVLSDRRATEDNGADLSNAAG